MKNGSYFFLLVALFCACVGCVSGCILFDIVAALSIVWAYIVYGMEVYNNDD